MKKCEISITVDSEWAPDELIYYTRNFFDERNITATFFMTGKTEVDLSEHEVALHPNFLDLDSFIKNKESYRSEILKLKELYPEAEGIRAHSLYSHYRLEPLYIDCGISYVSNMLRLNEENITPSRFGRLTEFPIYFMDYLYMNDGSDLIFDNFPISYQGLKVFSIHPHYLYLNSQNVKNLHKIKQNWSNIQQLKQLRNSENVGVRSFLSELFLNFNNNKDVEVKPLGKISRSDFSSTENN